MEQDKIENLQSEFQNRLRKRINTRKINIKEQLSMAGNISGTGILAGASIQGFPAYTPAFAGLFAFSVAMKVYNVTQLKKNLINNIDLNEYKEEFISSNLSIKEYMKDKNLSETEQQEFVKYLLPKKNLEDRFSNLIDSFTGEDYLLEAQAQVDYLANNKRKKIKP